MLINGYVSGFLEARSLRLFQDVLVCMWVMGLLN